MFLTFENDEEKIKEEHSACIEFQFCRIKRNTALSDIIGYVFAPDFAFGRKDSMFVHDEDFEEFYDQYGDILNFGYYANHETGPVDPYGINYYKPDSIDIITEKITEKKPSDYLLFKEWLEKARNYYGFYILGY